MLCVIRKKIKYSLIQFPTSYDTFLQGKCDALQCVAISKLKFHFQNDSSLCKAHHTLRFCPDLPVLDLKTGNVMSQPCQSPVLRLDLKASFEDSTCQVFTTGLKIES